MLSLPILFFSMLFAQPEYCSLDRVSHAVSVYETGGCTRGVGRFNNCHSLRVKGQWLHFKTQQESHEYFKRLWVRRYSGGCPTLADGMKYDSKEHGKEWLYNVTKILNANQSL